MRIRTHKTRHKTSRHTKTTKESFYQVGKIFPFFVSLMSGRRWRGGGPRKEKREKKSVQIQSDGFHGGGHLSVFFLFLLWYLFDSWNVALLTESMFLKQRPFLFVDRPWPCLTSRGYCFEKCRQDKETVSIHTHNINRNALTSTSSFRLFKWLISNWPKGFPRD